jgi:Fur family transcriptional regulator, ferric uptake regulator
VSVEVKRFRELLTANGYFVTQPRLRLFKILQAHNELTIPQLITLLDLHDQATVYRNIKLFENLGIVSRLRLGWHSKLELSDIFRHHHHHMTCLACGKVVILKDNRAIEQQIERVSHALKFKSVDHQLEIRGYCHKCQK